MRIAMVSEHASPLACITGEDAGGQNVHVAELATALAGLGHEVVVYTRRADTTSPDRVALADGVTVEHLRAGPVAAVGKDHLPPHMPEFGRRLRRAWAWWRPDVVHAHFWMSGAAAVPAAEAFGIPVFQTFHALGSVKRRFQGAADTSPPQRRGVERQVARASTMVVATSNEERDELLTWGVGPERVAVVPCGVDSTRFSPTGPVMERGRGPRVLSLGRLVPRKGVDTVVRAVAAVPEAELLVAGGPPPGELADDPEAVRLQAMAAQLRLRDRVRFLGCVDRVDVPALIRSVDIAVNVPWYEPFGISTLESMACGVPVIASRVGGHRDTVVPGRTGVLVPPRRPARLAESLRCLLADPGGREDLGKASRRRVEDLYTWEAVARATVDCYRAGASADVPRPRRPRTQVLERTVGTATGGED
ncbi:glycosyltransferase [Nocardiopsis sp. NPDC006938]|uniref:glycosyltransferase n=1 Tax=Nocardiopsis sp. NPDC006938 TaxID=3364337 RepID=UPI0036B9D4D6